MSFSCRRSIRSSRSLSAPARHHPLAGQRQCCGLADWFSNPYGLVLGVAMNDRSVLGLYCDLQPALGTALRWLRTEWADLDRQSINH